MNKIIVILAIGLMGGLFADNTIALLEVQENVKKDGNFSTGVMGRELIFIKHKNFKYKALPQIKKIIGDSVCSSKAARDLIKEEGATFRYFYLQEDGSTIAISIDNCKGISF